MWKHLKQLFKLVSLLQATEKKLVLPSNGSIECVLNKFATFFSDKINKIRNDLDSKELKSDPNSVTVLPIADNPPSTTIASFKPVIDDYIIKVNNKGLPNRATLILSPQVCLNPAFTL